MRTLLEIEHHKFKHIFVFLALLGIVVLASFAYISINNSKRLLGYFLYLSSALVALNLLIFLIKGYNQYTFKILSVIIAIITLVLLISGGYQHSGIFWIYPLLMTFIIINTFKINVYFLSAFFIFSYCYFYQPFLIPFAEHYSEIISSRYLVTLFLFTLIAMVTSYIQQQSYIRTKFLTEQLAEKNKALVEYKNYIDLEHQFAAKIFTDTFAKNMLVDHSLKYAMSAASVFSGDILASAKCKKGKYYILLGDVTGHGLAAATVTLSVYPMFSALVKKGADLVTIVMCINDALRNVLPINMMMATNVLEIDLKAKKLQVWAGGLPSMILLKNDGSYQTICSKHPPLSVLSSEQLNTEIETIMLTSADKILGFTDGVIETSNQQGQMFGMEKLVNLYAQGQSLEELVQQVKIFRANTAQEDDITIFEVTF